MIFIIDLDGTLIDSSKRHYILMEKLWEELPGEERAKARITEENLQFPSAAYMRYKADGNSGRQFLLEELNLEERAAERIIKQWTAQIEQPDMLIYDELYRDSLSFLEAIRKPENHIIYLTARQNKELVIKQLKKLMLYDFGDEIIVVEPGKARQQKTEEVRKLYKKYADDLKADRLPNTLQKTDMVIIGDTENEYELAKELDLPVYILHRGFRSRNYWLGKGVESFGSLTDILDAGKFW